MSESFDFGRNSEKKAKDYLLGLGWKFVEQNVITRAGEIDLVFYDHTQLVFIEVKARHSSDFGTPMEAITQNKLRHLTQSAKIYLHLHACDFCSCRIDAIGIDYTSGKGVISHLKNITM